MPCKTPAEQRAYQRGWVAGRRAAFFEGKSCVDCGSTKDLELDHVNPAEKEHHAIWSWSAERRLAEIAKCVVRCKNCHQERHAAERRKHGLGGYARGCRCEVCKAAKAAKNADYQRRRRESDPGNGFCRPAPNHSATAPSEEAYPQLAIEEAA